MKYRGKKSLQQEAQTQLKMKIINFNVKIDRFNKNEKEKANKKWNLVTVQLHRSIHKHISHLTCSIYKRVENQNREGLARVKYSKHTPIRLNMNDFEILLRFIHAIWLWLLLLLCWIQQEHACVGFCLSSHHSQAFVPVD